MPIEIEQFRQIEPGRALADIGNIEPGDGLFAAYELIVAMAPAEPQQVVEKRFRQNPELVAIGIDAQRAVAL